MVNIIIELSKYLMIILITMYTYICFSIFGYKDPDKKKSLLRNCFLPSRLPMFFVTLLGDDQ